MSFITDFYCSPNAHIPAFPPDDGSLCSEILLSQLRWHLPKCIAPNINYSKVKMLTKY